MPAGRMNHLHIVVRDLSRSIAFYERVFGLTHAYSDEEDGETLAFLHSGRGDVLTLHGADRPEAGQRGGMMHFGFEIPAGTLEEAVRLVEEAGGSFIERAGWNPDEVAYVRDPDGYVVEIYARA